MCLVEIEPRLLIAGGSESFMGGLKSELLISGALARLSGRAPRCSNGALPDGRASAPHHARLGSNTQLPHSPKA